jgi:hypothetical protein
LIFHKIRALYFALNRAVVKYTGTSSVPQF